jgi:death-on-curing protein
MPFQAFVIALHGRLRAEHGGSPGLRDRGLLESALAAPRNLRLYGDPDIFDLAAQYAHAMTRNHPFVDGNKRVAFAAAGVFLELNGHRLTAPETDAVLAMIALSSGDLDATGFANWRRVSAEPGPGHDDPGAGCAQSRSPISTKADQ